MTRPKIIVKIIHSDGTVLHEATKQAWNSALRETEAGVRAYARSRGEMFVRGESSSFRADKYHTTTGDAYGCTWSGERTGDQVLASIVVH